MATDLLPFDEAGAGPALVLLHAHPCDRTMWAPQLVSLADRFRVIAPDLPGYGETPSPGHGAVTTMGEMADRVAELLAHLGVRGATAVGVSMGGLVAMELGLRHAGLIDAVVLAATTAQPVTGDEGRQRLATADRIDADGILDVALDMAGRLLGPAARRDPAITAPLVASMIRSDPAGAAAALRGRTERPDYRTLLADLQPRALVIAGDHDAFASEEVTQELIDALPDPEFVRISGSGHLPNLEFPNEFDAAVAQFARASQR